MQKVARIITEVFSPLITTAVFLILVGALNGALVAGLVAAVIAVGLPGAVLALATRKRLVTDRHIGDHRQRWPFLLLALVAIAAAFVVCLWIDAPKNLLAALIFSVVGVAIVGAVNIVWKLSAHAAMTAFLSTAIAAIAWPWGLSAFLVLAAVCWSRVRLKDHTTAQVLAGSFVGVIVGIGYAATLALL